MNLFSFFALFLYKHELFIRKTTCRNFVTLEKHTIGKKFDYKLNKVFLIIKKILNKYKKASYVKQSKHSHETFHNNITIKDF